MPGERREIKVQGGALRIGFGGVLRCRGGGVLVVLDSHGVL